MKKRLDVLVYESGHAPSREMAQRFIRAGEVRVNGQIADKPGMQIAADSTIEVQTAPKYVSRGGEKLAGAFDAFKLNVTNLICADVGASTGGFTDCLLQNGASKVYAIDVGYGQIALKLRNDDRVIVIERTNARYIESLDEPIQFVSIDASFISLKILLPPIYNWLTATGEVVALIKPQFEAGKKYVGKGGVVKDEFVHRYVLEKIMNTAQTIGFKVCGVTISPITGPKGNVEFLGWFSKDSTLNNIDIKTAINTTLQDIQVTTPR